MRRPGAVDDHDVARFRFPELHGGLGLGLPGHEVRKDLPTSVDRCPEARIIRGVAVDTPHLGLLPVDLLLEVRDLDSRLVELAPSSLDDAPTFGENAYIESRKWFWEEDFIEHMIDGLRKAGLEVPDEGRAMEFTGTKRKLAA